MYGCVEIIVGKQVSMKFDGWSSEQPICTPVRLFSCRFQQTDRSLVANRVNRHMGCPRISQPPRRNQDIYPIETHPDTSIDAIDPQAIQISRKVIWTFASHFAEDQNPLILFNVSSCQHRIRPGQAQFCIVYDILLSLLRHQSISIQ